MDAFVLQVDGSKRWRLYDALIEQPRPDMVFKPAPRDIGEPFADFVLEAGDLLYLPSGIIHEAFCESEAGNSSLHLTVGIETTVLGSWESLLLELVVMATSTATCDVDAASLMGFQCPKNTTWAGWKQHL